METLAPVTDTSPPDTQPTDLRGRPKRVVSEETREKMRQAKLGRRHSEETKSKMRRAKRGVAHTAERKAAISDAMREAAEAKRIQDDPGMREPADMPPHFRWIRMAWHIRELNPRFIHRRDRWEPAIHPCKFIYRDYPEDPPCPHLAVTPAEYRELYLLYEHAVPPDMDEYNEGYTSGGKGYYERLVVGVDHHSVPVTPAMLLPDYHLHPDHTPDPQDPSKLIPAPANTDPAKLVHPLPGNGHGYGAFGYWAEEAPPPEHWAHRPPGTPPRPHKPTRVGNVRIDGWFRLPLGRRDFGVQNWPLRINGVKRWLTESRMCVYIPGVEELRVDRVRLARMTGMEYRLPLDEHGDPLRATEAGRSAHDPTDPEYGGFLMPMMLDVLVYEYNKEGDDEILAQGLDLPAPGPTWVSGEVRRVKVKKMDEDNRTEVLS